MNRKKAIEVYNHFQFMDSEIQRQWKEYYMAHGDYDIVDAIEGLNIYSLPSSVKKKKRKKVKKVNQKKIQREKIAAAKVEAKNTRSSLLGHLSENDRNRLEGWIYPFLRRISRKNSEPDIQIATEIIFKKSTTCSIPIDKETINNYFTERMKIIKKYPSSVKRKKKENISTKLLK